MVKDYMQSKIYKIYPIIPHDDGDIYIGSTCREYLCQRWGQHTANYKQFKLGHGHLCTSYVLFDKYGVTNCKCELIEKYPCSNIVELNKREGELQNNLECINKQIAGRSKQEYNKYYMSLDGKKERKRELQIIRRLKK